MPTISSMALDGFLVYFSSLGSGVVSMLDTAIISAACMRLKRKIRGVFVTQKSTADRSRKIELRVERVASAFAGHCKILGRLSERVPSRVAGQLSWQLSLQHAIGASEKFPRPG